ncbi:MAG: dTDP-glucose 4,6-dehydratase [Candidatus Omnitrophica bacterium]|jgi:dTDP-glucose 4,6-dehydratase|nr:dTDP-glucose 4,6-dehydratase [Candidatus Omnitrophota bacterium]
MKNKKILVTGGAGFIGSEFVRQGIKRGYNIVVIDKLTYAGDLARLSSEKERYNFYKSDICNESKVQEVFKKEKPQMVVHFAAETHVDRSILKSSSFIETNIRGTQILLDESRKYEVKKFIHISTDEVYGDIKSGKFSENSPLNPSSPYSASKAAADCLVNSYIRTYDFPAIIVRPSNNYGPWQYPEKFIPVAIFKSSNDSKIPIYAKGLNKREWLYVSDCINAIFLIIKKAKLGQVYNLGSGIEKKNIDVATTILKVLNKPSNLIEFVKDRPGHDYRYALDCSKINKLGWKSKVKFKEGIEKTIGWYENNQIWVKRKTTFLKDYWEKVYKNQ